MGRDASNKREWVLIPPPGAGEVDEQRLVQEVLQMIGYAQRLGFATTFSPIRVKDEDGEFFNGGYVFRSFSVPALTPEQYGQMLGVSDEAFVSPDEYQLADEIAHEPEEEPEEEPEPVVLAPVMNGDDGGDAQ